MWIFVYEYLKSNPAVNLLVLPGSIIKRIPIDPADACRLGDGDQRLPAGPVADGQPHRCRGRGARRDLDAEGSGIRDARSGR